MSKKTKWYRRIAKFLFFIWIIVPLCNCFSTFIVGIHILEISIHLRLYHGGTQFVTKTSPACGSSEVWPEYVYWWTQDEFVNVKSYYAHIMPNLRISEDGYQATGDFRNEVFLPIPFLESLFAEPAGKYGFYGKVTFNLFDLNQPDLLNKAQPGWCYFRPSSALYQFLSAPPSKGTLIVYNYDIWLP